MSSDTVISVDNLSKSYLIGHDGPRENYHSLRDTLVRHGKNYVRKAIDMARGRQIIQGDSVEEFWALKDVSFEVKRGDVLGIIGRNGAGKSTLLKILSRITEPTSGRVTLNGRVASLLEVGTGFHPELSGRENIFLNGAILGMARAEIKLKFDEIVDFAGVEKFLDTPVKRYSSGMYVRLAFAVAAHLEPEILIIDEVLAVGDVDFQRKCLGKMKDVAKGGRTVLFVSHNMSAVRNLCRHGILIQNGKITHMGESDIVVDRFLANSAHTISDSPVWECASSVSTGPFLERVVISPGTTVDRCQKLEIGIHIGGDIPPRLVVSLHLWDSSDRLVVHSSDEFGLNAGNSAKRSAVLDTNLLNTGHYRIELTLAVRNVILYETVQSAGQFTVTDQKFSLPGTSPDQWKGAMSPRVVDWS